MGLQPLPLDTESFELMRTAKEPMLYVDKTAYLHRLITDSQARSFFLARPRRFGKSLFRSTRRPAVSPTIASSASHRRRRLLQTR